VPQEYWGGGGLLQWMLSSLSDTLPRDIVHAVLELTYVSCIKLCGSLGPDGCRRFLLQSKGERWKRPPSSSHGTLFMTGLRGGVARPSKQLAVRAGSVQCNQHVWSCFSSASCSLVVEGLNDGTHQQALQHLLTALHDDQQLPHCIHHRLPGWQGPSCCDGAP